MPPNVRFFARFTLSLALRYSVTFIVRLKKFQITPRCSVCLRSCNYPFGILDVFRRILRHHWRCGMAPCILHVSYLGGYPESGRAIHRAEDLVGDSCATFEVIGPIHAVQPTGARSAVAALYR